ncbi:MAG: excinuclease ABC subunit C, partial [Deltaproteobacteria bacterium]|nr:excinuclease ABC subunit C [Deltaproteobacteria bacterium]MBW2530756.1 excinuclease ABC subunit C [Deltaproteobacteria bacterium]
MPEPPAHESLAAKLTGLPKGCGCYLLKDGRGDVVYIGKAKNLRSRVRSYFAPSASDDRAFLPLLRRVVTDLETVVTASEKEAAVLENDLIKQHQPRFNIKLRDDKDFLCLRLDPRQAWPRLETVRRPSADGARYFGPYHSATAARRTLRVVNKHFQLRTCTDGELRRRTRPCLQYQIKRCPGPCVFAVSADRYAEQVHAVGLFLDGRHDELTAELEDRMGEASADLEYELAGMYRDQLRAVQSIRETQRVVSVRAIDQDVIGMHREEELTELAVVVVRQGHVTDRRSLSLGRSTLPDEELLGGFLTRYYGEVVRPEALPDEIVMPVRPEAARGIADWAGERRGRKVKLVVPRKGPKVKLLA